MNSFDLEQKRLDACYQEGFDFMQSTIAAHGAEFANKLFNDYNAPGKPYRGTLDGYYRMKGEFDAIFKAMYKAA